MKIRDRGVTKEVTEKEYNNRWKALGYKIVEEKSNYEDLTVDELRELAKDAEIEGYYSMRKAELIEAIEGD